RPAPQHVGGLGVGGGLAEIAVVDLGRVEIVISGLYLGIESAKILEQGIGAGGIGRGIDRDAAFLLRRRNDRLVIRRVSRRHALRRSECERSQQKGRRERGAFHGRFSLGRDAVWCYWLGRTRSIIRSATGGRAHPTSDGSSDPLPPDPHTGFANGERDGAGRRLRCILSLRRLPVRRYRTRQAVHHRHDRHHHLRL